MLGLGIDADRDVSSSRPSCCASSITSSNVGIANWPSYACDRNGQPLLRTQRLDLGEREVLGEPAGDAPGRRRSSSSCDRELRRDVGRAADLVLVPRDQHAVLRRDQIRLDEIGAHLGAEPVAFERVLRPMAARAAVAMMSGFETAAASREASRSTNAIAKNLTTAA